MPNAFLDAYRAGQADKATLEDRQYQNQLHQRQAADEATYRQSAQNYLAGDRTAVNQMAAVNPEAALQFSQYGAQQDAQSKAQQAAQAKQSLIKLDVIRSSRSPKATYLALFPQHAQELAQQGIDVNSATDEQVLQTIEPFYAELAAQAGISPEKISIEDQFKAQQAEKIKRMELEAANATRLQQQQFTAAENDKNRSVQTRGQDLTSQAAATRANATTATNVVQNQRTWDVYQTAMQGLRQAMGQTETGPLAGRMPAITSAQQTAEGAESAMAPVLKQIFRVAGEGTFTDKDQELLMKMVPTRRDTPQARDAKIQNIDNIIKSKLGVGGQAQSQQSPVRVSTPQEAMQLAPGTKFITPDGRVKVR